MLPPPRRPRAAFSAGSDVRRLNAGQRDNRLRRDAKSGTALWSYTFPLPASALPEACCNSDNRGVTLTNDEVVFGTIDAHLVALDAKTGKALWNVKVAHNPNGYAITSRGEYSTRGFIGIRLRNRQTALETVHDSGP